ncbi:MAG: mechanosensitive ion channel family protein [Anaerovoracaceae bacterium]
MSERTIQVLTDIGIIAVTLAVGWIAIRILLRIEKKALERSKLDEVLHLFILKGTKITLWVVLIVAMLPKVGISPASLVAVLGAGGAAIALALKDSLSNVAGGIIILITKPFSRGDTIEIGEITGVVDNIDLLTTQLHTFDNKLITVPNGTVTNSVLINYSGADKRRVDCTFGISYETDISEAKGILARVAASHPEILNDPEPLIGVSSHGANAVQLDLKVWCSTESYYDVKYYLEEKVKLAFDEAGINIPYPQMDVHIIE